MKGDGLVANRRMIHRSISTSKQVNRMSEFAQLLFTWSIAHADDYGCLDGDVEVVMATVIPMKRDKTLDEVEAAIAEWVNNDLVWWYEVDGERIIQFRTWESHQSGLHKRTSPKYLLHDECMGSGKFREVLGNSLLKELKRTELNLTEQNEENYAREAMSEVAVTIEVQKDSSSSEVSKLCTMYQTNNFGQGSVIVQQKIEALNDEFGYEWVSQAFEESVERGKRTLTYVQSILQNWRAEGGVKRGGDKKSMYRGPTRMDKSDAAEQDARYANFYSLMGGASDARNDSG